ncbi:hypothetical protein F442_21016 [Phytophthora nicotianae P10297]|uniref:Uncharacterized protein n=1 Tax=Phytophthora nicotianae P10297 TaxID=1317064 RepID=W2Y4J3_PHYNI|nr:hypothetical protein F442_21016 [Phytophthora nicotianae P10297]
MNPEKARKFSLVRQAVRNLDRVENEGMESMELKRIVDATERKQIGNCDATPAVTMEEAEENLLVEHQEMPGLDTPEYWQSVFDVLGVEASDWDGNFDEESDYEASEDEQNREVDEPVYNGFGEVIPLPGKREFPRTNDPSISQETKLTGVRGQKFNLKTLFSSDKTFGLAPYMS